jgi:hypothetical protein
MNGEPLNDLSAPVGAATTTDVAGPGVIAVICVAVALLGLVLLLDLAGVRSRLVEQRIQQFRDHPTIAKALSEPDEDAERASAHRWMIGGGVAFIVLAVLIFLIWRG